MKQGPPVYFTPVFREVSQVVEQVKDPDRRNPPETFWDAERPVVDIAERTGATRQTVSMKIEKFE